jgi:hypothetical protein
MRKTTIGQPPGTVNTAGRCLMTSEWKSLHRLSVQLNVAVLLCGFALLFLLVYARMV